MRAICRQLWRAGGGILRSRANPKIDWRGAPDTSSVPNVRNFRVLPWTRYSGVLRPAFDGDEEGSRFGGERSGGSPLCRRRLTYASISRQEQTILWVSACHRAVTLAFSTPRTRNCVIRAPGDGLGLRIPGLLNNG